MRDEACHISVKFGDVTGLSLWINNKLQSRDPDVVSLFQCMKLHTDEIGDNPFSA